MIATTPLKLNLGCNSTRIPGFKNVDIKKERDADIAADVSSLGMIDDGSVEEVYASNILEHFPHSRTVEVLKEWGRVLKKGGKLWLSVPHWEAIVEIYNKEGMLTDFLRNFTWGDQREGVEFHYVTFTYQNMRYLLDKAGFRSARQIDWLPYGLADCSANRYGQDRLPVSLNMECIR